MGKRRFLQYIFPLIALLFTGEIPLPSVSPHLQAQLAELTRRGITHRFLDDNTIELFDPLSGTTRVKTLKEPGVAEIYAWAHSRGIPILEIDPNTLDTNQWSGWYSWWTQVPLSSAQGLPLIVGDIDGNGHAEVYGVYIFQSFSEFRGRIYEVDSGSGIGRFLHQYDSYPGVPEVIVDINRNLLQEIVFSGGAYGSGVKVVFEQSTFSSLPINLLLTYPTYETGVSPGYTGNFIGILDQDSLTDLLYAGSWYDSVDSNTRYTGTAVAEFSDSLNNFRRIWQRPRDTVYGHFGYSAADFDGDGLMEFVQSRINGWITVSENSGDNSYTQVWQDSIPFVNTNFHISGDVDGDGKPEFFIGATMSSGNWTIVFEADSNNHYSPKLIFHLLSAGLFDEPTYVTTDVNGNGTTELVIFSGVDLYVFKGTGDNDYSLWYFKREDRREGVQFYDLNNDGRKDFLVSKRTIDSLGRPVFYTDIYKANPPVRVIERELLTLQLTILENYPNPFNPTTIIEYEIPLFQHVRLSVYNTLGQEISVLVDAVKPVGKHKVRLDGSQFPSGLYFCRLLTQTSMLTRKMLLIR